MKRKTATLITALAFGLLLSACAPKLTPLSPTALSDRSGSNIRVVSFSEGGVVTMGGGRIVFGQITDSDVVKQYNLRDPAIEVGDRLARLLASRYSLSFSSNHLLSATEKIEDLAEEGTEQGSLVLFTESLAWKARPLPWHPHPYVLDATIIARLIDTEDNTILAEGTCSYKPEYDDSVVLPPYERLLANGAQGLKDEFHKAINYCVDSLSTEVFGF